MFTGCSPFYLCSQRSVARLLLPLPLSLLLLLLWGEKREKEWTRVGQLVLAYSNPTVEAFIGPMTNGNRKPSNKPMAELAIFPSGAPSWRGACQRSVGSPARAGQSYPADLVFDRSAQLKLVLSLRRAGNIKSEAHDTTSIPRKPSASWPPLL